MPSRTLVIGIPLPHSTFDNYSFASAPTLSEYTRLIVDISAVSRVVEDLVRNLAEHKTFAGQPIANGPTTAAAFGLADLLAMRRREAVQFFTRGGNALCIAYPDVVHEGISGIAEWRCYDWLPKPDKFRYDTDLLPGFGKTPAQVSEEAHPFAPYLAMYGSRMAYRVHAAESSAAAHAMRSFGISSGGVSVAFDVNVGNGRIVFVPPLSHPQQDRIAVAGTLFESFVRYEVDRGGESPDSISKEGP